MLKKTVAFILVLSTWITVYSQNNIPEIGAEVFIEPGQTSQEIDTWFKRLKENQMTVTRIRMFESYMHKPDGSWDYSLFDEAFKAGEKYGIKIYANLFPETPFSDLGGFKFPRDEEHLRSIAIYIKNLVTHFKQFKSCYGWVPINEPGSGHFPREKFSLDSFEQWKDQQIAPTYTSSGYAHLDFAEERFLLDYNTWFLKWLTDEIHKYDPESPIHVNNHAIFQNVAEYDFPKWRKFLTSLGASAHASWHFGYFNRSQYALAIAANSEIIRSGAGNIPWIMTELQGGNNTYSGSTPMCPTTEEISQWVWTTIGTASKGAIFWCLNPRASGGEAGEWALLDFQNNPSDRMQAAAVVASVIKKNGTLFNHTQVAESGINILYTRESLWIERKLQTGGVNYEGRAVGGSMKSALGYFEALSEMGLQTNLKAMDEFDFSKSDYTGVSIILAHQIAIPSSYWQKIAAFVNKGGKLIADGLTAYYDENAVSTMKVGFPFKKLFGGTIKEYKFIDNIFNIRLTNPALLLPAHLWRGTIDVSTAIPIGQEHNQIIATRNKYGRGEAVWIPSLVGLGSRIENNYNQLSQWLYQELKVSINNSIVRFSTLQPGMLMKTLQAGNAYVTVIINKSQEKRKVFLQFRKDIKLKPVILFNNKNGQIIDYTVNIFPEETMVIQWK